MKVYKITRDGYGAPLYLNNLAEWNDILGTLEYDEVGDKYIITIEEMDEREFNDLPEWGGF
jgi:hypothetical protein